jgi:prepilin-type processing-associated H-X9-DG protein
LQRGDVVVLARFVGVGAQEVADGEMSELVLASNPRRRADDACAGAPPAWRRSDGQATRHRGRADVLHADGRVDEHLPDAAELRVGQPRPPRVVRDDADGRVEAVVQGRMPDVRPTVRGL